MKNHIHALCLALLTVTALPLHGECSDYTLYQPKPLTGEATAAPHDEGIVVKRIVISPGDTLSKISRRYAGRGSYYPQILLFNKIKNPDLIIAGQQLYVPISTQSHSESHLVQTSAEPPQPAAAKPARTTAKTPAKNKKNTQAHKGATDTKSPAASTAGDEQKAYKLAMYAYRNGDCKKSLALLNHFLEIYPASPLVPDALFYRAECLFKISSE